MIHTGWCLLSPPYERALLSAGTSEVDGPKLEEFFSRKISVPCRKKCECPSLYIHENLGYTSRQMATAKKKKAAGKRRKPSRVKALTKRKATTKQGKITKKKGTKS